MQSSHSHPCARKAIRRFFFLTFGILFAASAAAAEFGFKVGPGVSIPESRSSIYLADNLFGAKAGLFFAFTINEKLSLQPEVNFAMKGASYKSSPSSHRQSLSLNYLEVPLLLGLHSQDRTFAVLAGPYVAALLKKPLYDDSHNWTAEGVRARGFDAGLAFSGRFHRSRFFLEIQYALGLIDVLEYSPAIHKFYKNRNRAVALMAGMFL